MSCHLASTSFCSGATKWTSPVMKTSGPTRSAEGGTVIGSMTGGGATPIGTAMRSSMSVGWSGLDTSSLTP